jgi:hypothetical protein
MSDYQGNIVIKNPATPTGPAETGSAPGVWKLSEVLPFVRQGIWPTQGVQAADTFFRNVSLLLSTTALSNANNNLFVDSSGAFNPISRINNTTQGSVTPYSPSWSTYFDGTGDEVLAPNTPANFGSSNFTAECWVMFTSNTAGYQSVMGNQGSGDGQGWIIYTETNNRLYFAYSTTNSGWAASIDTGVTPSVGVWTHLAVVRNGTAITFYVNGVASGTPISTSSAIASPTGNFRIGRYPYFPGGARTITAWISNVRLVNGTAVYTANFTPPTSPLTAISNTSLLTSQSNRFRDASLNGYTITVGGNPAVQDFSPFAPARPGISYNQSDITNWSNYFDGNGDYLTVPSSSAFNYGTGDFTIECWGYRGSPSNFWCAYSASGVSFTLFSYSGASSTIQVYSNGFYDSGINPGYNTWFHVAVTRSSGTLRIFINGVQGFSGSYTTDIPSHAVRIGSSVADEWGLGNVSNLRVVKGTALYTSNFTPPTTNLTAVSGTSLLTCQNAAFTDNSTNSFVITPTGNTTVTGNSPFNTVGYWSNYFDGSGDYLLSPSNSAFALGTGDYTVECWIYATSTPSDQGIYEGRSTGAATDGFTLTAFSGSVIRIYCGSALISSSGTSYVNQWTHVAVTRASGTTTLWINGVSQGTSSTSYNCTNTDAVVGGGRYSGGSSVNTSFPGYISNFRIVKGTAVYTGAFTPPTSPLTAISGTSLLTCQNGSFRDNSTNNFTLTVAGNTSVQSFDPFYTSTIASNGGSMYFDGSGDYLTSPSSPNYTLGTGDFIVEVWVYPTVQGGHGSGNNDCIIDFRPGTGGGAYGTLYSGGSGTRVSWYANTTNVINGAAIPNGAWSHLVVSRVSGNTRLFINGEQSGSTYADSTNYLQAPVWLGQFNDGAGAGWFQGYMSGARIVKGSGVSSSFTPPTAPVNPTPATTLLLNGMNAGIYDATAINDMETVGNAQVRFPTPFAPANYYATYLNGSSYLTVANNTALDVWDNGSGSFTVEAWIYATASIGNNVSIVAKAPNNGSPSWSPGWAFQVFNGYLNVNTPGDSRLFNSNTTSVPLNQWVHCALVKSGSTVSIYQNGVRVGTITNSTAYSNTTDAVAIGVDRNFAGSKLTGFVSNVRMVKGTAVYDPTQATLTVPTSPLTAITNTSLLTCQNKTFIDNSTNAFTITSNGSPVAGAIGPFTATGGTSMYFDGNDDLLVSPSSPNLDFGTSDFTIEMWVNPSNFSGSGGANGLIVRRRTDTIGTGAWAVYLNASGNLLFQDVQNGSVIFTSSSALTVNKWQHVAVTRSGTTIRGFIDGVLVGSGTSSISYSSTWYLILGMYGTAGGSWPSGSRGSFFTGYMDDVRITRGIARYTSNFTPPTQPFPIY